MKNDTPPYHGEPVSRDYRVGGIIAYPPVTTKAEILEKFPPGQNGTWLRCRCLDAACIAAEKAGKAAHVVYVTTEALDAAESPRDPKALIPA